VKPALQVLLRIGHLNERAEMGWAAIEFSLIRVCPQRLKESAALVCDGPSAPSWICVPYESDSLEFRERPPHLVFNPRARGALRTVVPDRHQII
jgi:hypothetical protein